jgi:hypothetical protein
MSLALLHEGFANGYLNSLGYTSAKTSSSIAATAKMSSSIAHFAISLCSNCFQVELIVPFDSTQKHPRRPP